MGRPQFSSRNGKTSITCPLKFILALTSFIYGIKNVIYQVEAAASNVLLGGKYAPTTDVEYIESLTAIIEAIEKGDSKEVGLEFYQTSTLGNGFSLESIGAPISFTVLDQTTNPLYPIYMYAYWRSKDGNGSDGVSVPRENMTFINEKVDYYGQTVITAEFEKDSRYSPELTAETIRVTNMWMATVQSLYDGIAMCHNGPDGIDTLTYVNPIDKAAAFWIGTHDDPDSNEGGSLFAWAGRSRAKFSNSSDLYSANDEIVDGLVQLKTILQVCLDDWEEYNIDEQEYEMRKLVIKMSRAMTVPLVQNLLHYAIQIGESIDPDSETLDYLILYGLVTSPPIVVCDSNAFGTLFDSFVSNARDLNGDVLYDSVYSLFNSFTCLGVTCDQIGFNGVVNLPECNDLPSTLTLASYEGTFDRLLESAVIDLDVLTIGTLIEMEANAVADDVYQWNYYGLALSMNVSDESLWDMADADNHEKNTAARQYDNEFTILDVVTSIIARNGNFSSASSDQSRVMAETILATIVLPIYSFDLMYKAIDFCNESNPDTDDWDKAVASIIGFSEGPEDGGSATNGALFYNIAKDLCRNATTCNFNGTEVNRLLIFALKDGKQNLMDLNCTSAEENVKKVELFMQTVLVNSVAYFAEKIAENFNDVDAAYGYGFATALFPLVRSVNSSAAETIKNNLGFFDNENPLSDGLETVLDALRSFSEERNMNCSLLSRLICDETDSISGATISSTSSLGDLTTLNSTTVEIQQVDTYSPTYAPSITAKPSSLGGYLNITALDGGVPSSSSNTPSLPLLGGAYTPTSNVDHILKLTMLVEDIENSETKDAGLYLYTQEVEVGLSLQTLSTGHQWEYITKVNPLYVIYMYGFWSTSYGDNDSNGYSNKKFNNEDLLQYGDTIIMDVFQKPSDYDPKLSAEAIRVLNLWMGMVTEMYKAVESCRDGSIAKAEADFNPIDFAAAFWFGTAEDIDSPNGGSLFAWASNIGSTFVDKSVGLNSEIIIQLNLLQKSYEACKGIPLIDAIETAKLMKKDVDVVTRLMTIPLLQNFQADLATKAGMAESERDYLILYSLTVLPMISICDEDTLDELFSDLVTDNKSFDSEKFSATLKQMQDKYDCLGISCSSLGTSTLSDSSWPTCNDQTSTDVVLDIAGYTPTSKLSFEVSKIDLDVSTILSFIVMEANDAAMQIYKDGRNVFNSDGTYISLDGLRIVQNPIAVEIYNYFENVDNVDCFQLSQSAIAGVDNFISNTPLQNSAVVSRSLATIDLHLSILDNIYETVRICSDLNSDGQLALWERAVALMVGSAEGTTAGGSPTNGYLFFQIAQEVCAFFDSCNGDGKSEINMRLIAEFENGLNSILYSQCDALQKTVDNISLLLQTILVDTLVYHLKAAASDETHAMLIQVSTCALLPFIRSVDEASANNIEQNIGNFSLQDYSLDVVYSSLKEYVSAKNIDCTLLGSSICEQDSLSDSNNSSDLMPNDNGLLLANGEYKPLSDVSGILTVSSVVNAICNTQDQSSAKLIYQENNTAGFTIQSLSLSAKDVMTDELLFNQYVFALFDEVDKTDGSLRFDNLPAGEYANTIASDAFDDDLSLGCLSVKVLIIWMWVIHQLNQAIAQCTAGEPENYGAIDIAATMWIGDHTLGNQGGLLYELAEQLGQNYFQEDGQNMTYLNRKIIDRLNYAQTTFFVDKSRCKTDVHAVSELRKVVKETISYMSAVLMQGLVNSMLEEREITEKEVFVELYSFAFLPIIMSCGHDDEYNSLYSDLVVGSFDESMVSSVVGAIHRQLNCLGLVCADIGRHILADDLYPECFENLDLMSYTPVNATKANMPAKLDLDAVAIHQLISLEKYDAAKNIYLNGHNYYDYDNEDDFGFVSLYNLTQSSTIGDTNFPTYTSYTEYFGKDIGDYANELLLAALDKRSIFEKSTSKQRELAVAIIIKSFISYMSALEALYVAVSNCPSNIQRALTAWDGGASLLIGSVESAAVSAEGINGTSGLFFYSLTSSVCEHFDTCTEDGSSKVGDEILAFLTRGQGFINESLCTDASDLLENIVKLCAIPLIQSVLYFVDSSDTDNSAAGYVASLAVLPIINEIDVNSAARIKKVMRLSLRPHNERDIEAVFDAFRIALSNPKSNIDCNLVSNVHQLCVDNPPPEIENATPSVIANGLYIASNYVTDRSSIALDVKDIESYIKSGDLKEATALYLDGANSLLYDDDGKVSGKRSISSFSFDKRNMMNPLYNYFLFGLSDEKQEFIGKSVKNYADSFVIELLDSQDRQSELAAPNAMVALHLWMQVTHKLFSAYDSCKSTLIANERRLIDSDASLYIDEAAAYWIGDNQETGSSSVGHLLYALTEFISEKFEEIPEGSQSYANSRIIDLFNEGKNHIDMSKSCSTSPESHFRLKKIIEELISFMIVPLLRGLFYYLSIGDHIKIKLYALSVLPLFSTCSESIFLELKNDLIDNDNYDYKKEYIFSVIHSMYDCLGVTCSMIGYMPTDNYTICDENVSNKAIAGYSYTSDELVVTQHARIDIDIKNIEVLLENGINIFPESIESLFGLAYDLYGYGKGSNEESYFTPSAVARSTERDIVPTFSSFRRYFNDDVDYADTMIVHALTQRGVFSEASPDERRRAISFSLRYMVTYMGALEKLYSALKYCHDSSQTEASMSMDIAAAYIVGRSEGQEDGGTYDGVLLYMLAKRMCTHFNTCTSSNNAASNERIVSLLYAAQGEIDVGACDSLSKTIKGIENALIVPLIQGTLFTAVANDVFRNKVVVGSENYLPEGFILAQSILPLIYDVDKIAAEDIERVMVKGFPKQETDSESSHAKVFHAIQVTLPKLKGVDCTLIGTINGVSFCPGSEVANPGHTLSTTKWLSLVLSLSWLAFYCKR